MSRADLLRINAAAYKNTVHPSLIEWPEAFDQAELDFISRLAFEESGHEREAIVYITKELAQLAEIERHVSAVLASIVSELQGTRAPLGEGFELHDALSCFAAEELLHANMFYRYVRVLSRRDFKLPDNLFGARLGLYLAADSPYVKLAALSSSAYIGESVITVFERRAKKLDPQSQFFITRLLHIHGLDEARHIKTDHFIFDQVIPSLEKVELRRMRQILEGTEALNTELAMRFQAFANSEFGVDYTVGNRGSAVQLQLTLKFRELVFGGPTIRKVDEAMTEEDRRLVEDFCSAQTVHA